MGGIQLQVDGNPVRATDSMCYKSMMFSGIPNLALTFGYTNASWTLKCDLTCEYVCRLLNHMKAHGYRECVPRLDDPSVQEAPFYGLTSGYVQRARHLFPKQGNKSPWRIKQNYAFDVAVLRGSRLDDGVMQFR